MFEKIHINFSNYFTITPQTITEQDMGYVSLAILQMQCYIWKSIEMLYLAFISDL